MGSEPTRVMVAVNDSTIKGYPNPSISCKRAFEWTLEKIVRSNTSDFKMVDEDGFDEADSIYASPEDFREMRESNKAKGVHFLEFFVKKCHEIGVGCEAWIKRSDPKDVICQEVIRVKPNFLVLGSRGLGRFQKVFVETVSAFCELSVQSSRSNAMPMKLPVMLLMTKVQQCPSQKC